MLAFARTYYAELCSPNSPGAAVPPLVPLLFREDDGRILVR
jgi:hypothetical protein